MYEAPTMTEVGSVRDLTLGEGWAGNDDTLLYFIRYGTIES
ncbi:lasso RiPP family leader peptide-containing protein [Pseudactinotalea terrae]|nr:lasso RiPP family leader peptide-containing protein [Pseudactinotalea terrae]